jgi:prepilin-type N-terminal cleavage/methylation domain-containing protein
MMRRPGFTLIEVMAAIVITGVVAVLVFGTARLGIDTDERLERYRMDLEARAIVRTLLVDALRHPVEGGGAAMNDTLFAIADAVQVDGLSVDGLYFVSRGVATPLGASATWAVSLVPVDSGIRFRAVPAAESNAGGIETLLTSVRGLNVRVLSRSADSAWSDVWDAPGRVPAVVVLEFLRADGAPAGPPVVVHSALEPVR